MENPSDGAVLRELVRLYVRAQRESVDCSAGLSTVQCHVLNELLRKPDSTQKSLAESSGLDKGWISRAVDALIETGDLIKDAGSDDRRSRRLSLTAAGKARAEALNTRLDGHGTSVLTRIDAAKRPMVAEALSLVLDALQTAKPATCGSKK